MCDDVGALCMRYSLSRPIEDSDSTTVVGAKGAPARMMTTIANSPTCGPAGLEHASVTQNGALIKGRRAGAVILHNT